MPQSPRLLGWQGLLARLGGLKQSTNPFVDDKDLEVDRTRHFMPLGKKGKDDTRG